MPLIWYEYAVIAAILAGTLLVLAGLTFGFLRVRVQKWIGGAIGNFMTNLAEEAGKEGVEGGSAPGMINLGGFKIDVGTIKELLAIAPQALQLARMFGLTGTGGGGGGGKIGL